MVEEQGMCNRLLLLMGSNPLQNYFAALILKPNPVRLCYSPEAETMKDYPGEDK